MGIVASQELKKRRELKFRRELERYLTQLSSSKINSITKHIFQGYSAVPTPSDLMQMILTSKFGGGGNSICEGGDEFTLEVVLRAFNLSIVRKDFSEYFKDSSDSILYGLTDISEIWNCAFYFSLDKQLMLEPVNLDAAEFRCVSEISPYLFLDIKTSAFGFVILPHPAMSVSDHMDFMSKNGINVTIESHFGPDRFARFAPNGFDSGEMQFISATSVVFGTIDKLIASLPDRKQHDVRAHPRTYKTGKVVNISPQKRRNPLRLMVNHDLLTEHIVYCVLDADKRLRYIGEGKADRWKHVNSGVSHNYKINEHLFVKGEMEVKVLYEGLTKTEALTIERALLKKNAGAGLWNSRDYEPFENEAAGSISDREIEEFLNR
jgi:hypothetical protein